MGIETRMEKYLGGEEKGDRLSVRAMKGTR